MAANLPHTARVLIVGDEAERIPLAALVEKEGYDVSAFATGKEVRYEISAHGADLVVTELNSGDVDGFNLLEWVKRHSPDTHVVLLTGHVSDEGEQILRHRGVDGHLVKPVEKRRLQILLRALLVPENLDRTTDAYVLSPRVEVANELDAILASVGIGSEFFSDPRAVLARADDDPPHLIIIDLDREWPQPVLELCRDLRTDPSIEYAPILILCENPQREVVAEAARLHVNGFLSHPVEPEVLKERVLKMMRHTRIAPRAK